MASCMFVGLFSENYWNSGKSMHLIFTIKSSFFEREATFENNSKSLRGSLSSQKAKMHAVNFYLLSHSHLFQTCSNILIP